MIATAILSLSAAEQRFTRSSEQAKDEGTNTVHNPICYLPRAEEDRGSIFASRTFPAYFSLRGTNCLSERYIMPALPYTKTWKAGLPEFRSRLS
jgi:hypothetical protein